MRSFAMPPCGRNIRSRSCAQIDAPWLMYIDTPIRRSSIALIRLRVHLSHEWFKLVSDYAAVCIFFGFSISSVGFDSNLAHYDRTSSFYSISDRINHRSYRVNTFSMFQIYSLVMLPMHHRCLSHGFISFFLVLCKRSFLRSSQLPPAQQACRPINSSSILIFLPADLSKQGQ